MATNCLFFDQANSDWGNVDHDSCVFGRARLSCHLFQDKKKNVLCIPPFQKFSSPFHLQLVRFIIMPFYDSALRPGDLRITSRKWRIVSKLLLLLGFVQLSFNFYRVFHIHKVLNLNADFLTHAHTHSAAHTHTHGITRRYKCNASQVKPLRTGRERWHIMSANWTSGTTCYRAQPGSVYT